MSRLLYCRFSIGLEALSAEAVNEEKRLSLIENLMRSKRCSQRRLLDKANKATRQVGGVELILRSGYLRLGEGRDAVSWPQLRKRRRRRLQESGNQIFMSQKA